MKSLERLKECLIKMDETLHMVRIHSLKPMKSLERLKARLIKMEEARHMVRIHHA